MAKKKSIPVVATEYIDPITGNVIVEKNEVVKEVKLSPFTIMDNWFKDGRLDTPVPEDACHLPQTLILNHFSQFPQAFVFINKLYNNFSLFSVPMRDILKTMKEILHYTRFRQVFVKKDPKPIENKLFTILKSKYPYYKNEEISMVVDYIDSNDEIKESVYESLHLREAEKKKITKKEFKEKMSSIVTKESVLDSI